MKHIALLATGLLMLQAVAFPMGGANRTKNQGANQVTGFVVPSQVGAKEPFTFAATNVVQGEVISVKTVEGEVVQTKRADKLGRVFLPAGLAAGAYILSTNGGKSTSNLNVLPPRNLPNPADGMSIPQLPGCVDAKQGMMISGQGFSGDAAEMTVKIGNKNMQVLASSPTALATGPLPTNTCGENPVEVKNNKSGDTSHLGNVMFYELSAKLSRQTIAGGEQTALEFTFKPSNFNAYVNTQILGGPVSFQDGGQQIDFMVIGGKGKLPLRANPAGQGPFRVAYDLNEILGTGTQQGKEYRPTQQDGAVGQPAGAGAGAAGAGATGAAIGKGVGKLGNPPGGTGKDQKGDNAKKQRCPKTKHIRDEATGWEQSEKQVDDPANPGKKKTVYMISRTVRCSIYKSCSKEEGHAGECAFGGKNRCKDHDITETREYESEQARKDGMKDTAIPEKIKYPG